MNDELEKKSEATLELTKMLYEVTGDIKFKASYTLQNLDNTLKSILMDNMERDEKYYENMINFFEQLKELAEDFIRENK